MRVFLSEEPQWWVFFCRKSLNGAVVLFLPMVWLFFSSVGPSMVLSHSRNRVAAPEIFQWCSFTLVIVWLLQKFSNGAISLLESCGCSENFPMVWLSILLLNSLSIFLSHAFFPFSSSSLPFSLIYFLFSLPLSPLTSRLSKFFFSNSVSFISHACSFFSFLSSLCDYQIFFLSNGVSFLSHVCSFFLSFFMCSCSLQSVLPLLWTQPNAPSM